MNRILMATLVGRAERERLESAQDAIEHAHPTSGSARIGRWTVQTIDGVWSLYHNGKFIAEFQREYPNYKRWEMASCIEESSMTRAEAHRAFDMCECLYALDDMTYVNEYVPAVPEEELGSLDEEYRNYWYGF